MAVSFNSALSQYLAVAAPRPELAGLTDWTLVARISYEVQYPLVYYRTVVSFSTGLSPTVSRGQISLVLGALFAPPDPPIYHEDALGIKTAPDGSAEQVSLTGIRAGYATNIGRTRHAFVAARFSTTGAYDIGIVASSVYYQRLYAAGSLSGARSPTSAAASLRAAIGAEADGSADFFPGSVEDVRVYDTFLSLPELQRIHYAPWDLAERNSALKMRWRLQGRGTIVTEADTVGGVVATAVNGPAYAEIGIRRRRRNRGG